MKLITKFAEKGLAGLTATEQMILLNAIIGTGAIKKIESIVMYEVIPDFLNHKHTFHIIIYLLSVNYNYRNSFLRWQSK